MADKAFNPLVPRKSGDSLSRVLVSANLLLQRLKLILILLLTMTQ